jgi:hypothetical protein
MAACDRAAAEKEIEAQTAKLLGLPHQIGEWFLAHRIPLRMVKLAKNTDGIEPEDFWMVTDHTRSGDNTFRIIYDDVEKEFGYECLMENDVSYFIGFYGDLKTTLIDLATI